MKLEHFKYLFIYFGRLWLLNVDVNHVLDDGTFWKSAFLHNHYPQLKHLL